jgi:hypothetical protein
MPPARRRRPLREQGGGGKGLCFAWFVSCALWWKREALCDGAFPVDPPAGAGGKTQSSRRRTRGHCATCHSRHRCLGVRPAHPAIGDQPQRLGRDLLARQRVAGVALGLVDTALEQTAIRGLHADLAYPAPGIGGVDLGIKLHAHLVAQLHGFLCQIVAVELRQPRMAVTRRQRQHGAHGELALVHGARPDHGAQHIDGALVHMAGDLGQVGGVRPCSCMTCSSASAAGWVWRQEACHLNEVSAVAQRVPSPS